MAKSGYRKSDDPNYSQENNKVNLDTNVTAFGKILYYLKVASENQPLHYDDAQNKIFPAAKQAIGSEGDPNQPDEHAVRVLTEFKLIESTADDPRQFSVSAMGKRFLDTFTYEKVPDSNGKLLLVGQRSKPEQLMFFFDLMSGVQVVAPKYGRNIKPYVCLMRFLLDPQLGGFIRKNEWALFLNSSETLNDAQYDAFVAKIRDFRISCGTVGNMKKMERTLSRFVEPGVLVEAGGTGENTAYELNPDFAEIVKANFTLEFERKEKMTLEQRFVGWAQTQDSVRTGEKITLAVAKHYAAELRDNLKDQEFSAIEVKNIFDVSDVQGFATLRNSILNTAGFSNYDESGYFSRALKLYGLFLEEVVKMNVKTGPYLAVIRTKPFILLAGISGTGKSRLVRQLARGCCPAEGPLAKDSRPGNFEMIQVRSNWHDSTELMGYVTRITANQKPKYVITPFVRFLVKAWLNPEIPFFLCLDEMNLAPVEQYFAEYLSVIETRRRAIEKDVVPGCIKTGDVMTDVLVSLNPEVVEGVISELSEAFSLDRGSCVLTETPPVEEKKRDKDSLYKQWDEFLAAWPISRLRTITLDEYTKAGSPDTFTYALEAKLSRLGSIWGGSAFKFGIYSRDPNGKMTTYAPNSNQMGNAEYAWYRKFGSTQEAAWSTVKERVVAIAEAASKGDFSAVDKIDLPHVVKWKIAFLYQDRKDIKIVDVFKREWIYLLTANMPPKTSFADRYLKLNEERNGMDVFEWDDTVLTRRKNELLSADGSSDADDDDVGDEDVKGVTSPSSPFIDMIRKDGGIRIPPNLVVMGTVNMDETTCSFSRKVLDRAMTFELNEVDMDEGLASDNSIPYGSIPADQAFATDVEGCDFYPANKDLCDKVKAYLLSVNAVLEDTPFKFAYRSRNEIMLYCIERTKGGVVSLARALDEATSMKILSRIEGDDQKLLYVGDNPAYKDKTILDALKGEIAAALKVVNGGTDPADCTVCAKKLVFMARRLGGGFTNFFV